VHGHESLKNGGRVVGRNWMMCKIKGKSKGKGKGKGKGKEVVSAIC
jgi:hypothetical protein